MAHEECVACDGRGFGVSYQPQKCKACDGAGYSLSKIKERIVIPPTIEHSAVVKMKKKGNWGEYGPPGHLILDVKVKPHKTLVRKGFDIYSVYHLTLSEAVLGKHITVETIHGKANFEVKPGTQTETKHKLKGMGILKSMNPLSGNKKLGHHYVTFKVVVPKQLNAEQRKAMAAYADVESKPRK